MSAGHPAFPTTPHFSISSNWSVSGVWIDSGSVRLQPDLATDMNVSVLPGFLRHSAAPTQRAERGRPGHTRAGGRPSWPTCSASTATNSHRPDNPFPDLDTLTSDRQVPGRYLATGRNQS